MRASDLSMDSMMCLRERPRSLMSSLMGRKSLLDSTSVWRGNWRSAAPMAFRFAARIGVCHVEEVDAGRIGRGDDGRDCSLVRHAVAESGPAAEAERAELKPAPPQIAILHAYHFSHASGRPMKVEKKSSRSAAPTSSRSM